MANAVVADTKKIANQIAFLNEVDKVLDKMQANVNELRNADMAETKEELKDTMVSDMKPGTQFPIVWDGHRATAIVDQKNESGHSVVNIIDENGNDIQRGVDDIDDEQWEALRRMAVEMENAPVETAESVEVIENEPQPIGKGFFGNIYDQFKGKIKEAFDFLISHKEGDLLGVFHRDDIGDIDLIWGSSERKEGLEHIIEKHINRLHDFANIEEAMNVIDDVIKNGTAIKENPDKVNLDYNGYRVSIKKQIRDDSGNVTGKKNWVVTAFDKERSVKEKERSSSGGTLTTPPTNQSAGGVTLPPNEEHSGSKDTTISDTSDKKNEKNIPRDKKGEPMYESAPVEQTVKYLTEESPLPREQALKIPSIRVKKANDKLKSLKAPQIDDKGIDGSEVAWNDANNKYNEAKTAAEDAIKYWTQVQAELDRIEMENQGRLNQADVAAKSLEDNLKQYFEAPKQEVVNGDLTEPNDAYEFIAMSLSGIKKAEKRLNKLSVKHALGWGDSDLSRLGAITTRTGGLTVEAMAENLYNEAQDVNPSFFTDERDARNALESFLQSVLSYGDITSYVKRNRTTRETDSYTQQIIDSEAKKLGYESGEDLMEKRMADAQQKLESLKDKNGFITEEGLKEFQDYVEGLKIKESPEQIENEMPIDYGDMPNPIETEEVPFQKVGKENTPLTEEEVELRDALVETLRDAGIEVVTDSEEAQRVLDEANGKVKASMSDSPETFKERQKRAVKERGIVMPGLKNETVNIVRDIPKHPYTGTIKEATKQAIEAARNKYNPNGEAKPLYYNNNGQQFTYTISKNAIDEYLNSEQQKKSVNKGVHLALADHIDDVINNSIEVEEHPDYEKNDNGIRDGERINPNALMHRFYGVAEVDGKLYRVMTLMREDMQDKPTNGIRAYEAQKIEVLNEESPSTTNGVGTPSEKNSTYPVAKLVEKVEKAYDKGKNILEESEKTDGNLIKFFRTPDGKAYGLTKDGKIYVDPSIATSARTFTTWHSSCVR